MSFNKPIGFIPILFRLKSIENFDRKCLYEIVQSPSTVFSHKLVTLSESHSHSNWYQAVDDSPVNQHINCERNHFLNI